jgi:hypothetical protein
MMRLIGAGIEPGFVRSLVKAPRAQQPESASPTEERSRWAQSVLWTLIAVVSVAGVIITGYGFFMASGSTNWTLLVVLTCLAIAAERADFSMYGSSRVSLAFVPIFAAIVACGMTGLAAVTCFAVLASAWGRPVHKTSFNFGALIIAGTAAVVVLHSFDGIDYGQDWPEAFAPAALAGGVNFLVNTMLVASAIALSGRSTLRAVWKENFLWLLPHYLVLAALGLAIVAAYAAMGLWGLAVFIAPPLMMRVSIKQYLDKTTKNVMDLRYAHKELQEAHEMVTDAMTSLGNAYDGDRRPLRTRRRPDRGHRRRNGHPKQY